PLIDKIKASPDGHNAYWVGIGVDSFANNHLACRTDTSGAIDKLTYSKIDKDGNIVIPSIKLADGLGPAIIADINQNIHMVYCNPVGLGNHIDYLKLDQNGNILIGPRRISPPEIENNTYVDMAIDSLQFLHVVWQGDQTAVFQILYCKLDTLGDYVTQPMKIVLPPYTQGAGKPMIAVDNSNRLHVVWIDNRLSDDCDIFYKRGENEPGIMESERSEVKNLPRFSIFPNPFSHSLHITNLTIEENIVIKIFNTAGEKVINHTTKDNEIEIDTKNLSSGVYFVQLETSEHKETKKVILLK
ncbi:T9SS type A sorting domain-containing protein, partial [candidate division WOR-3 bacterium]|nr:T9SS type A sorting domain-containing protein [candidate division WOR-3 bacterium]